MPNCIQAPHVSTLCAVTILTIVTYGTLYTIEQWQGVVCHRVSEHGMHVGIPRHDNLHAHACPMARTSCQGTHTSTKPAWHYHYQDIQFIHVQTIMMPCHQWQSCLVNGLLYKHRKSSIRSTQKVGWHVCTCTHRLNIHIQRRVDTLLLLCTSPIVLQLGCALELALEWNLQQLILLKVYTGWMGQVTLFKSASLDLLIEL